MRRTKENIYKVGRTRNPSGRYTGATLLICTFPVSDQLKAENDLLAFLRGCNSFVNRTDVGREFFQGDFADMHALFSAFCQTTVASRKLLPDEIACPTITSQDCILDTTDTAAQHAFQTQAIQGHSRSRPLVDGPSIHGRVLCVPDRHAPRPRGC